MIFYRNRLVTILSVLVSYQCYCEDSYLLLCEGQTSNVTCQNNLIINVISATYGYNGSNEVARQKCDDWWNKQSPFRDPDNTDCHNPESTTILTDECNGRSECTVIANNRIFGDPCRGTIKYFELYYNCNQDNDIEDYAKTGLPHEQDKSDDDVTDENNRKRNDGTGIRETKGLSPVSVVAIFAGIPVVFIIVIFSVRMVYFLQNKRHGISRDKKNDGQNFKRNNVRGSLNLEYEIVGNSGNNPTTGPANEMPQYESSIHVHISNFEYDYAVERELVRWNEPQASYLNVK